MAQALATTDLQAEHDRIRAEAARLAEGAGDIPGRVALLHAITNFFDDSLAYADGLRTG